MPSVRGVFPYEFQVYQSGALLATWPSFIPSLLSIYFVANNYNERYTRYGYFLDVKPELIGQLQQVLYVLQHYLTVVWLLLLCVFYMNIR